MRPAEPSGPDGTRHLNRLEVHGGAGDVVQARDVHGGVHFHQSITTFAVTPRQLPGPARGFVNRDGELASLAGLVTDDGNGPVVVVVTGTAGVGKTSLVLRWAHSLVERFPGGQLYADLRGYSPGTPADPQEVLGRFLRDLGVPARAVPTSGDERASLYLSMLAGKRILVVLDNAAAAGQVRPLLSGSSGCLAIVTSRSDLSGLVVREGARRLSLDLLAEDDAVALLRAVMAGYRREDPPAELAELARLCARLPLALRIAAERAASRPARPLAELIADLRDESGLWDGLSVGDDTEADAVATVFAWSYRALPEPAAALFRRLGLHPGREFGLPAAAVLGGVSPARARADLDALVGAHLVESRQHGRYQLHDLLRAYAAEQVRQSEPEPARTRSHRRILAWFLHSADAARRQISPFSRYPAGGPLSEATPLAFEKYEPALRWYEDEATNLVAAVRAAAATGEPEIAWRLAVVLRGIYMHQNSFDDWIGTSRIGVEAATQAGDRAGTAEALDSLGMAYFQSRRLAEAGSAHQRALEIRRELGDRFGEAISRNALGLLGLRHRRLAEAATDFRQGAEVFAGLGERRWAALLRANLAEVHCEQEEFGPAVHLLQDLLPVFRELTDRFGEGNALFLLAWAERGAGRLDRAQAAIGDALAMADDEENDVWRAHWLVELARIRLAQGDPAGALTSCQRAAVIQRRLGDRSREATALDLTGEAYQQLGRFAEAAAFHRRAAAGHGELADRWQQARALAHLAAALDRQGEPGQARGYRRESASLLAEFTDPATAALRRQLSAG